MFDCYRGQGNAMEDSGDDSDDSNEENHYGNEYPDSDESTGERAIRRAMNAMQLQEEMGEESSDDDDFYEGTKPGNNEDYCHTVEVDEPGFKGDVDFQDTADRYGVAYAKYKRKILKAFENAKEVPTDDEDDRSDRSSDSDYFGTKKGGDGDDDDDECFSENELDKYA